MKQGDRVRFIDKAKDKQFGVLTVLNVKGQTVTFYIGDPFLGNLGSANLSELTKE